MPRVEASIQQDIIEYLRGQGAYVRNMPGTAITGKGTADLLVCYRGRFVAIEVKRPDGSYGETRQQAVRRRQVVKAEGVSVVVTCIGDVATALRQLDKELAA
jgi:hypothetical protein